jgi:hypothetical protein
MKDRGNVGGAWLRDTLSFAVLPNQ